MKLVKHIGLIGGISYLATIDVYRYLNQDVRLKLGGSSGSRVTIDSINQQDFVEALKLGTLDRLMVASAQRLEKAGCDFVIIACNTAHLSYEAMSKSIRIPIIHIADTCAYQAKRLGLKCLGLLGSMSVMTDANILVHRLQQHGLRVVIPSEAASRTILHDIVQNELSLGILDNAKSKKLLIQFSRELAQQGAEGLILGCTEIPLVIKPEDLPELPLLDTAALQGHFAAAVQLNDAVLAECLPPKRSKL